MRDDHRLGFRKLARDLISACGGTVAASIDDSVEFLRQQAAMDALEAYVDEKTIEFGAFVIEYAREHNGNVPWPSSPDA
jgi:hypothetical protein